MGLGTTTTTAVSRGTSRRMSGRRFTVVLIRGDAGHPTSEEEAEDAAATTSIAPGICGVTKSATTVGAWGGGSLPPRLLA
ncbi:hypothetical protein GUJ93_ZPchr0001g32949 [Zizania palustris]|uniref:Uncharacterized protein n=1 Tax=Zizania palustris TaxID=103762 RepID=A0A8J5VC72_ZIZPA|nr:hypothetical protein GUJ93_ZPchr0001g32949 [Zizania palustris]